MGSWGTSWKQREAISKATGISQDILQLLPLKGHDDGSPYDAWEMSKRLGYSGGYDPNNLDNGQKNVIAQLMAVAIPFLKTKHGKSFDADEFWTALEPNCRDVTAKYIRDTLADTTGNHEWFVSPTLWNEKKLADVMDQLPEKTEGYVAWKNLEVRVAQDKLNAVKKSAGKLKESKDELLEEVDKQTDDIEDPFRQQRSEQLKRNMMERQGKVDELEKKLGEIPAATLDIGTFADFINWIYYTFESPQELETKTGKKFDALSVFGKGITITPKESGKPRPINEDQLKKLFGVSEKLPFSKLFELLPYEPEQTGLGIRNASYYPVILEHYLKKTDMKDAAVNDVTKIDHRLVLTYLFNILKDDAGSTIDEIREVTNRTHEGSKEEIERKGKKIWHNKTEVDQKIQSLLGLDRQQVERKYPNGKGIFYNMVVAQVSKLRKKGIITDWDDEPHTAGIWRLTPKGREIRAEDVGKILEDCYIWSVSAENWKLVKEKLLWASKREADRLNGRQISGKFLFYVSKTNTQPGGIRGIYQSGEEWSPVSIRDTPVWTEEWAATQSRDAYQKWHLIFPARIGLQRVKSGFFDVFDEKLASELSFIKDSKDPRMIALAMKPGGQGYPSNNGKPIPVADYDFIFNNMTPDPETGDEMEDDLNVADEAPRLVRSPEYEKIIKKITDELLIEEDVVYRMMDYLASGSHLLLEGPIGTGKTHLARLLPELFSNGKFRYESKMYTATSEWTTQDVIGGIVPKMKEDGQPMYDINYGCVVETLRENLTSGGTEPKTRYWTVIDEFNRAPIDKSFGPLFTALRDGRLGQIPSKKPGQTYDEMSIPRDYRIIGTLNTQDKSFLFNVSNALRSRFVSVRIGVPEKEKAEQEIYFAAKHALEKLAREDNYKVHILLDHEAKRLDDLQTDDKLLRDLEQAYWVLASVRLFYGLGTALLVEMYKIIIDEKDFVTSTNKVRSNALSSEGLDEALTAKLIPQLDQLTKADLGAIRALHEEHGVVKLFKHVHQTRKRGKYEKVFGDVLRFLDCWDKDLVNAFRKDAELKPEQWEKIEKAQEDMKDKLYDFTSPDGIDDFITKIEELEEKSTV